MFTIQHGTRENRTLMYVRWCIHLNLVSCEMSWKFWHMKRQHHTHMMHLDMTVNLHRQQLNVNEFESLILTFETKVTKTKSHVVLKWIYLSTTAGQIWFLKIIWYDQTLQDSYRVFLLFGQLNHMVHSDLQYQWISQLHSHVTLQAV